MRFVHYSANPYLSLDRLYSVFQSAPFTHGSQFDKPCGLWFSDDDDYGWKEWCEAEGYRIGKLQNAYLATLDLNSILHISNMKDFAKFHKRYSIKKDENYIVINWKAVAEKMKGIIISPYLLEVSESLDLSYIWYWGWDVACACIWDVSAIKRIQKLEREEEKL